MTACTFKEQVKDDFGASCQRKFDSLPVVMKDLMNFVLNKTGQLLQGPRADAVVSMSAAWAIVQVCEVAETHNMPMPVSTLDSLLQLIQQATTSDVSLLMPFPCHVLLLL